MRIEQVIGLGIRDTREISGMTQAELGQAIERYTGSTWSRQAVSAAEAGKRAFTAADLLAIALALGTSISLLMAPLNKLGDLELPNGEPMSVGDLLDVCFGPADLLDDATLLRHLVNEWCAAQDHATNMQSIIRNLITEDGADEIFGKFATPAGGAAQGVDQPDQEGHEA